MHPRRHGLTIECLPEGHPLWPQIKALLKPAEDRGGVEALPTDYTFVAVEDGIVFAAVTVRQASKDEAELIHVAGTRMAEWLAPMEAEITDWLKGCGARVVTAGGRKGWARLAAALGWAPAGITERGNTLFEKVLTE